MHRCRLGITNTSTVLAIRKIHSIHLPRRTKLALQQYRTLWTPDSLAITPRQIWFRNQIQKGRRQSPCRRTFPTINWITGSRPRQRRNSGIPTCRRNRLWSSTITSDYSEQEEEDDFWEPEYEEYDNELITQNAREDEPQFAKFILQELISAQYHERFCSDICRRLNEGETLSSTHDDKGLLVRTLNADHWFGIYVE